MVSSPWTGRLTSSATTSSPVSPAPGRLRFIEVKVRVASAETITVTKNEILYSLKKPDEFILAIVEFDGERVTPYYLREPFRREPDCGVTSVNYDFAELLSTRSCARVTAISYAIFTVARDPRRVTCRCLCLTGTRNFLTLTNSRPATQ